jgi:hypothetical protein
MSLWVIVRRRLWKAQPRVLLQSVASVATSSSTEQQIITRKGMFGFRMNLNQRWGCHKLKMFSQLRLFSNIHNHEFKGIVCPQGFEISADSLDMFPGTETFIDKQQ